MKPRRHILVKLLVIFAILACIGYGVWYWLDHPRLFDTKITGQPMLIVRAEGGCGMSEIGCPITTYYDDGSIALTHNLDTTAIRHPNMSASQTAELKRLIAQPATTTHTIAPEKCSAYVDGIDIEYEILDGPTKGTYSTCQNKGAQSSVNYNDALLEFYKKVQ